MGMPRPSSVTVTHPLDRSMSTSTLVAWPACTCRAMGYEHMRYEAVRKMCMGGQGSFCLTALTPGGGDPTSRPLYPPLACMQMLAAKDYP